MLTLDDLEVRQERLFENRLPEQRSIGNNTGEQDDDNVVFVNLQATSQLHILVAMQTHNLNETWGELILWRSPDRGLEVLPSLGVVELNGLEPSGVEEPSDGLSLVNLTLERRFRDELVGLVVLVVGEIRSQEEVDHGDLRCVSGFECIGVDCLPRGSRLYAGRQSVSLPEADWVTVSFIDNPVLYLAHGCSSLSLPCTSYVLAR